MKESTKTIFQFLKDHQDPPMTAAEVAEALGVSVQSVNGTFTMAIQRKGLGDRMVVEGAEDNGKGKLLVLNDAGMAKDLDAEEAN